MKKRVLGLFCFVLAAFSLPVVWAHGGVGIEKDPCVRRVGPYLIHFAVYQPQFNSAEEYCAAVPKAGNTILVFDLVDSELRSLPLTKINWLFLASATAKLAYPPASEMLAAASAAVSGVKLALAIGAMLVYFHSSSFTEGKPNSSNRAIAFSRTRPNHTSDEFS